MNALTSRGDIYGVGERHRGIERRGTGMIAHARADPGRPGSFRLLDGGLGGKSTSWLKGQSKDPCAKQNPERAQYHIVRRCLPRPRAPAALLYGIPANPAAGLLYVRHDERADRAVITTVLEAHPIEQETFDLEQAQFHNVDRQEYIRRKTLAESRCGGPIAINSKCYQSIMDTGR
jgi:hypothetical protein